ncbi:hypothetical protein ABEI56_23410 [Peribacillus castrilensis]|uniref:hypothetical protein n=1 Tax=Peribacillus castrilensis TaxID=2897690 RepID=UPI003D2ACE7B
MFDIGKWMILLTLITSFYSAEKQEIEVSDPQISRIYTNIPLIDNWVVVPKGTEEITIHVKAINTETVLFWRVPSGTGTWKERELLGYDTNGTDGWSLTWNIEGKLLHDHIHVQALSHEKISNDLLNITRE